MSNERVEFEQTADGLFRGALQAREDSALVEKLRAAGLDVQKKLAPAYPAADFYRWVRIAATHRFPALSEDDACREVGKLAVTRGLQATLIGVALLKGMQLLGVRRSLSRIGRAFRNGNNYIEATVNEVGPTRVEIRIGPVVGPPGYYEGVLEQGPLLIGAKDVQVERVRTEGEHIVWHVEWTE